MGTNDSFRLFENPDDAILVFCAAVFLGGLFL